MPDRQRRAAMLVDALVDAVEKAAMVFSVQIREIARERICEGYLPEEIKQALTLLERRRSPQTSERRLLEALIALVARSVTDELYLSHREIAAARALAGRRRQLDLLEPVVTCHQRSRPGTRS